MMRRSASTSKSMSTSKECAVDDGSKQWYTLVRLDEDGGVGHHVVSDEELRELEELILSEPDSGDRSSDDGEDSQSDGEEELRGGAQEEEQEVSASEQDSEAEPITEDTSASGDPVGSQYHRYLPHQLPGYQKPGGPCDHCGAQGERCNPR